MEWVIKIESFLWVWFYLQTGNNRSHHSSYTFGLVKIKCKNLLLYKNPLIIIWVDFGSSLIYNPCIKHPHKSGQEDDSQCSCQFQFPVAHLCLIMLGRERLSHSSFQRWLTSQFAQDTTVQSDGRLSSEWLMGFSIK